MRNYDIYMNMKRWLILYGIELLDLLFPIENDETDDPMKRYLNLTTLFDKHFNLLAYYQTQPVPDLPLILVSFDDLTGNSCFAKIRVIFDVYFQTVSPADCKDNRVNIINSPEAILGYKEQVNMALKNLLCSMDDDLRFEVFDDKPWEYPINYSMISETYGELHGVSNKEILHFQSSFVLDDNVSCCK